LNATQSSSELVGERSAEVSVSGLDECCLETATSPADSSKDNDEDTDVKTADDEDDDGEESTNNETEDDAGRRKQDMQIISQRRNVFCKILLHHSKYATSSQDICIC